MSKSTPPVRRALILSGGGGRGAYQVGVWRRLQELGWQPDLVCGTSIGAVNGALICSGWNADQMEELWGTMQDRKIFKVSFWRRFKYRANVLLRRSPDWAAFMDSEPLRTMVKESIDVKRIRQNKPRLVVSATNVCRGVIQFFTGENIGVEHVVASCSVPVIFPWCNIDGEFYWDGGVLANTPVFPAIEAGACEIVVVMLSPFAGHKVEPPKNTRDGVSRMFDIMTLGASQSLARSLAHQLGIDIRTFDEDLEKQNYAELGDVRIGVVGPKVESSMATVLDLDFERAKAKFSNGYDDACEQLQEFMAHTKESP
jgi:NTE family protein